MPTDYSNHSMSGFTKLFSSIVHSTVWREDMHVKVVWVTMLALSDRNGKVLVSLPGLADASRVSMDQCIDAIFRLKAPDKWSRTKAHEGRRIIEIDGGWELLNYLKYREHRDEDQRRLQNREAVARHRAKDDVIASNHGKPRKPMSPHAEAEAEGDAEKIQIRPTGAGDDDFAVWYKAFPKKKKPRDAAKAWRETAKERPPLAEMLHALSWQRRSHDWTKEGGKYCTYPATYLRAGQWADEQPQKPDGKDPRGTFIVGSGWVR